VYPTQLTGAERQAVAIAHFFVVVVVVKEWSKREISKLLEWWENKTEWKKEK